MAKAQQKPAPVGRPFKVRATRLGYYDIKRRRVGDVFTIAGDHEFSSEWMERVSATTPDHETGAQAALDQQNEDILGRKAAKPGEPGGGADDATGNANPLEG